MEKAQKIAVAMSGGVDSSVAAALLLEQGHKVVGITMRHLPDTDTYIEDAQKVAEKLGIEHHIIDLREQFQNEVIKQFAESYAQGETPNPCAVCNRKIKFGTLLNEARKLGADVLATGHYAQIIEGKAGYELHSAEDTTRDQSYFLFALERETLKFLRFPLGLLEKTEVRALAKKANLTVSDKPDSQDICFVPDGNYTHFVHQFHAEAFIPGDIVDRQNNVLGHHEGIIHFTIGQRRGLNISNRTGDNNEPLFVLRLEPETHRVIVGPREALAEKQVQLRDINWLGEEIPEDGIQVTTRLRSTQTPVPARFYKQGLIVLDEPVFGIAPGQAAVFYNNSRLLGGGWIMR